jgi:hypothetical protein
MKNFCSKLPILHSIPISNERDILVALFLHYHFYLKIIVTSVSKVNAQITQKLVNMAGFALSFTIRSQEM